MTMLSLDDPRWAQLHHAYGVATDVPDLLRALARGEDRRQASRRGDVWDMIWSALCHQGDVDTASYAALPHIVAIGAKRPTAEQSMFWSFAGAVALSDHRGLMPDDLRESYDEAVREADRLATACIATGVDESSARQLLWAMAALRGWRKAARGLEALGDDELAPNCPACETQLYVTLTKLPFVASDEDPVGKKKGHQTLTRTRPPRPEVASILEIARGVGHEALAAKIAALDADVTCPNCDEDFSLLDCDA
jgi:hypothetical protein